MSKLFIKNIINIPSDLNLNINKLNLFENYNVNYNIDQTNLYITYFHTHSKDLNNSDLFELFDQLKLNTNFFSDNFNNSMNYIETNKIKNIYITAEPNSFNNIINNKNVRYNRLLNTLFNDLILNLSKNYTFINKDSTIINMYYTNMKMTLNSHYDLSDGILVQIKGSKKISLLEPKYLLDFYQYPCIHPCLRNIKIKNLNNNESIKKHIKTYILEEGDSLYIPKYWIHFIENINNSESISLTLTNDDSIFEFDINKLDEYDDNDTTIALIYLVNTIDILLYNKLRSLNILLDWHRFNLDYNPEVLFTDKLSESDFDDHIKQIYSKLYFLVKNNYEKLVKKKYETIDLFLKEHSRLFYSQIFDINTIPQYFKNE